MPGEALSLDSVSIVMIWTAIAVYALAFVAYAFDLARRRYWPCVGVWVLAFIVEIVVNAALGLLPTLISGITPGPVAPIVAAAGTVFAAMVGWHAVIGVGESVITALVVSAVVATRPDLVYGMRFVRVPAARASEVATV